MAEIKIPIHINLPDDWVEQIVERLRNDPEAEWIEVTRCKDCKHSELFSDQYLCYEDMFWREGDFYCGYAERRENVSS